MKYRALDVNEDYSFGQGSTSFLSETDAVAQAIYTRLRLFLEEWWEDTGDGLPYFQSIAGAYLSRGKQLVDSIIQKRIQGTKGVTDVYEFVSTYDPDTRHYSFQCKVNTIYGSISLEEVNL